MQMILEALALLDSTKWIAAALVPQPQTNEEQA
jgi:hypothetical protein